MSGLSVYIRNCVSLYVTLGTWKCLSCLLQEVWKTFHRLSCLLSCAASCKLCTLQRSIINSSGLACGTVQICL